MPVTPFTTHGRLVPSCAADPACLVVAGQLLTKLLWTSDACLLMSILGWVTIATIGGIGAYMWWMVVSYWILLRAKNEDVRRVMRAIASLPCRRYHLSKASPATGRAGGVASSAGGQQQSDARPPAGAGVAAAEDDDEEEAGTCAICLGDFEEGDEVRLLPCMHEFCKECIDGWISRQGLQASCPLCKRMLIPRAPGRNSESQGAASADAASAARGSDAELARAAGEGAGDLDGEDAAEAAPMAKKAKESRLARRTRPAPRID